LLDFALYFSYATTLDPSVFFFIRLDDTLFVLIGDLSIIIVFNYLRDKKKKQGSSFGSLNL
jgi:hypothetical protein